MDKVEICNIALSRIGMDSIERIDEASQQARKCQQFYDVTRRNVLRAVPWPFATRRVRLALKEETPPDYKYAYGYPADAVCLRKLFADKFNNIPEKTPYKIVSNKTGKLLYTNVADAWIEYTADVTDCSLFDDGFIQAFSWKLAAEMAFTLTSNNGIFSMCVQMFNDYKERAMAEAMNEENVIDQDLDTFANARFSGI